MGGTQVGVAKVVSRAPLTAGRFKFKGETEGGEGGGVGGGGGGGGGSSSSSSSSSSASSSAACSVAKSLFDLIELAQEEVRELPRVQKVRREERDRETERQRETETETKRPHSPDPAV